MSIKMRLLLSYLAMTVIPVITFALIAAGLISLFNWGIASTGTNHAAPWQSMSQRDELFAGVKFMAQTDPDRLNDPGFLKRADERMSPLGTGLAVLKGSSVIFASPYVERAAGNDLHSYLQRLPASQGNRGWPPGPAFETRYQATEYAFKFGDGSDGILWMLSDTGTLGERFSTFFPILMLALLAVIALTNGVLTYMVSRSIIKPLNTLKQAAVRIKDGDLGQEVTIRRKDEIGQLAGAFEEMRTRLKESIRLQLQYEDNRKELISNISHDLKTPITGIKACVEGIRDGIADSGPMRDKYMDMIARKTDEMDRLIDELFLFSKLDLNRLPFTLEPTNLTAYLQDCTDELRLDPRLEGITVVFSPSGEGPVHVQADREKLRRVIMNIVDNSLKYMHKPRKELRVELIDGAQEATVHIRDNGAGIESSALPHIFDRFYRAEPSRNTDTGGSGLGLAIVKQMVEGQGGKVWAESRLGEGTCISFSLPTIPSGGESN